MADTSLIESKIGLLIWKTSNHWQSNLRKVPKQTRNLQRTFRLLLYPTHVLLHRLGSRRPR